MSSKRQIAITKIYIVCMNISDEQIKILQNIQNGDTSTTNICRKDITWLIDHKCILHYENVNRANITEFGCIISAILSMTS